MTRMGTDKEGLGYSRRANGAEKQQIFCKRACASFDFSSPIPLCGIIHATQAIYEYSRTPFFLSVSFRVIGG